MFDELQNILQIPGIDGVSPLCYALIVENALCGRREPSTYMITSLANHHMSEPRRKRSFLNRKKNIYLTILALPALIAVFIFSYLPMPGLIIAFKKINYIDGIFKSPWNGLENFKFFFTSSDALSAIRNTLCYNLAGIVAGTFFALLIALLLNEVRSRTSVKIYQTVFFLPYFFSWIIVTYMVLSFMSGDPYGILVNVLKNIGVDVSDFYWNAAYWPAFLILLSVWKGLGYWAVIYYAAIIGIPPEYYEAASTDGATRLQSVRFITLPQLTPLICIMVLLSVGKIFNSDFGLFYFVPRQIGYLVPVTQTIDTYVYRMLTSSTDLGMSAAVGLFQSVMAFIVILTSNSIVKKINPENSAF